MLTKTEQETLLLDGREISLSEANEFINQFNLLKKCVKVSPEIELPNGINATEVKQFITSTNEYNAFVFSKELIKRFFDEQKGKNDADYLVVVLGAYFQDASPHSYDREIGSKQGAFTVLTTGCVKEKNSYKVIDIHNPVNQYAPNMCVSRLQLDLKSNSFNIIK
ncbi:hypothetical protein [Kordia sp.]|uniref:hypothetical protein n=1 Tax=Kordia sp. TaxID=1965332 RepID=UPI003D267D65